MFYVLLKGEGDGCDYTIGCNLNWRKLKAEDWESARKEVGKIVKEFGHPKIEKAILLEVGTAEVFDVQAFNRACEELKVARKIEKDKAERKAQYEKLKAEFEVPGGVDPVANFLKEKIQPVPGGIDPHVNLANMYPDYAPRILPKVVDVVRAGPAIVPAPIIRGKRPGRKRGSTLHNDYSSAMYSPLPK